MGGRESVVRESCGSLNGQRERGEIFKGPFNGWLGGWVDELVSEREATR